MRIQVLNEDESHAGGHGEGVEEFYKCFESACRGTHSHRWKGCR